MASEPEPRTPQHSGLLAELLPLAVHALAQPVNILQGYADLLPRLDERSDHRARALLAIGEASGRLADILADLRRAAISETVARALIERYGRGTDVSPPTDA